MRVPAGLYNNELNRLTVTEYRNPSSQTSDALLRRLAAVQLLCVAEGLMLSPKVSFRVYGENVVAALLLHGFGPNALKQLLRDGALEFLLETEVVTYSAAEKPLRGLNPLQHGAHNSTPHVDPLASATLGLRRWGPSLSGGELARLAAAVADCTKPLSTGLAPQIVPEVHTAYTAGALTSLGIPPVAAIDELPLSVRKELCRIAEDLLEGVVCCGHDYDLYRGERVWRVLSAALGRFKVGADVHVASDRILNLERLPSIASLLLRRQIRMSDIPDLRLRDETRAFQRWLWSQPDPSSVEDVERAYLCSLLPGRTWRDTAWFKPARIFTINLASTLLGSAVAGPLGATAGAAAGLGLSLIDGLWLDRFLSAGIGPRRFATDLIAPLVVPGDMVSTGRRASVNRTDQPE